MKVRIDEPFRANFDPATGRLIIDGPSFSGIATLEGWEPIERAIRQARHRARLDSYEGQWPAPPKIKPEF